MRTLYTALIPLAILLLTIFIAAFLGYGLAVLVGDALPLRKLISKTTLILLVLSIYPIMVWLKLNKQDLGLTDFKTVSRQTGKGLLYGVMILAPVILCLWYLDLWHYDLAKDWTPAKVATKILGLLVVGLLVSVPEELIFRGILISGLGKKLGINLAIATSAVYYAGLHFLKSKTEIPAEELTLLSSYWVIADGFGNLFKPGNFPGFVALFMVGAFLGCVRTRIPQSLGLCIGLHAGWVFSIKLTSAFLDKTKDSDLRFLVSDYDGIIGPLVSFWLVILTLLFLWYKRRQPTD